MRKYLLLILLLPSFFSYSQCADDAASDDTLGPLLNLFLNMDLVVGPDIYNPENDPGLKYVIFNQDTIFGLMEPEQEVYAVIDRHESKKKLYCIGAVKNYQIDDWVVGIKMTRGFADGREEVIFYPLHFNDIPISFDLDYDYATYGVNVDLYWAYGDGQLD